MVETNGGIGITKDEQELINWGKGQQHITVIKGYMGLTGNAYQAMMLSQVHMLYENRGEQDKQYIVRNIRELADECGLSVRRAKHVYIALKAKGLIESTLHYHVKAGELAFHIRPNVAGILGRLNS